MELNTFAVKWVLTAPPDGGPALAALGWAYTGPASRGHFQTASAAGPPARPKVWRRQPRPEVIGLESDSDHDDKSRCGF